MTAQSLSRGDKLVRRNVDQLGSFLVLFFEPLTIHSRTFSQELVLPPPRRTPADLAGLRLG